MKTVPNAYVRKAQIIPGLVDTMQKLPTDTSTATRALRRFNTLVRKDVRVDATLLSIGDGLYMIRKKG